MIKRARTFGSALSLVWAAAPRSFVAVVALFAFSGLGMAALIMIGNALLQELVHGQEISTRLIWLVLSALLISGVISFAGSAGAGGHRLLAEETIRYCQQIVLEVTARVRLSEFDNPAFHDRIQRASRSGTNAPLIIAMAVPQLIGAVVGAIGIAVGLATINPLLVPVTVLASLPLWLVGRANSEEMYSFSFGDTANDRARFHLERIVKERESAPEVRAFGLADFLVQRWETLYQERLRGIRALVRRFLLRSGVGSLVGALVIAGVLVLVWVLVQRDQITLVSGATASVAVLLLANRSQQAASSLAQTLEHGLYLEEFIALRELSGPKPAPPNASPAPFRGVTFSRASFHYPAADHPVLKDIDLTIRQGEVVAVVGHNGSGKTTLAKLISGLYAPTSGQVTWIGWDAAEVAARGAIPTAGVVFQDFGRYWFSAADNIGLGDVRRIDDREEIQAAARQAGAADFLDRLEHGLDTPLTSEVDGGTDLSGGQWQRVAIARVLMRQASLVVLDEPTAALDAEAEAALFATLQDLREGRTVVMISHRFSTVRSADRIIVLDDGRLVEDGSHDQLMAADGRYARMYRLQADAYAEAGVSRENGVRGRRACPGGC